MQLEDVKTLADVEQTKAKLAAKQAQNELLQKQLSELERLMKTHQQTLSTLQVEQTVSTNNTTAKNFDMWLNKRLGVKS